VLPSYYLCSIALAVPERQMNMLDSSCAELGEQKHYGIATPGQVVNKSVYTRNAHGLQTIQFNSHDQRILKAMHHQYLKMLKEKKHTLV